MDKLKETCRTLLYGSLCLICGVKLVKSDEPVLGEGAKG